jgi:hypothetical protein
VTESAEARDFHRIIRASVRECLETWGLQAQAGRVTVEALEAIVALAAVRSCGSSRSAPELVVALLPSFVRTMLTAFLEVMAEQRDSRGPSAEDRA